MDPAHPGDASARDPIGGTVFHQPIGRDGPLAMLDAANYSAVETLRDGRRVEIRAFRPSDRADLESAVARTSNQSLYLRFFTVKRRFSEREREFFLNVDFVDHVALMAWAEEAGRRVIVGGGRYVVVQPGKAEVAFVVIDQYQGQGLGAALMRHLAAVARAAGLQDLTAEVLPENEPMLRVFEKSGLYMTTTCDPEVVHVTLQL
jgi:RimJ/RimL family protein N-acetyltransferase